VVGFLFDESFQELLLLEKRRPSWQAGLLNGIGGKIEPGEDASLAMWRESMEEMGTSPAWWTHFVTLQYPEASIDFFWAAENVAFNAAVAKTDEPIVRIFARYLSPGMRLIPNLRFLIPMAIHSGQLETISPVKLFMTGNGDAVATPQQSAA
jgi:hypothetical protein